MTQTIAQYSLLYVREVAKLHRIPSIPYSDRGIELTLKILQRIMGIILDTA